MRKLAAKTRGTLACATLAAVLCWGCGTDEGAGGTSSGSGPNAHQDGTQGPGETDVDCGGQGSPPAPRCAEGRKCVDASDCESLTCDGATKLCSRPTPTDKLKNGDETGVDCGGPEHNPRCPTGQGCAASTDCESKVCDPGLHTCNAPAKDDGLKNGDETDVDCGGTTTAAPRCATGKICNVHADCASDGCGYDKKCVENKTCAGHHGGDTCGPTSQLESCCTEIEVTKPGGAKVKIDKFMITAGRFRQFVERTNADLRGYIAANRPTWWETEWDAFIPNQLNDGERISHEGVYQELGPGLFYDPGPGNQGCDSEYYGARTYWIPGDVSRRLWDDVQQYGKDDLDEKALTCATFFMYAAFCAWDGGRMPSVGELDFIYTGGAGNPDFSHKYPWGQTPAPAGWDTSYDNAADALMNGTILPSGGDPTRSAHDYNWWSPNTKICIPDRGCDWSVHVAPPGRFPNGNGPFGHSDLAGLLLHMTSNISGAAHSDPNKRDVVWNRSGSWEEAHDIPFYPFLLPILPTWKATSKYRAAGARCAHDVAP